MAGSDGLMLWMRWRMSWNPQQPPFWTFFVRSGSEGSGWGTQRTVLLFGV